MNFGNSKMGLCHQEIEKQKWEIKKQKEKQKSMNFGNNKMGWFHQEDQHL